MYLLCKTLHLLGVVAFLGNIVTGLFWKAHADRTGEPRIIAHALDGIIRSDRWFTIPGVMGILVFGILTAILGRLPLLRTPWILWSIVLFTLSGVAFGAQVAPLQVKLRALAKAAADGGPWDEAQYHRLSRRWELWGLFATLTPLVAFALMVFKPAP